MPALPVGLPNILVVGGDGFLGSAFSKFMEAKGYCVTTSSRRSASGFNQISLDLKDLSFANLPTNVEVAYLFAGVTSIAQCRDSPEATRAINVEGTLRLAEKLASLGIRIVFLSTNLVFDGSSPNMRVDAPTNPQTEYGNQKAMVEKYIASNLKRGVVLRLGKVLCPDSPLLMQWLDQLRSGNVIRPFKDRVVAPASLELVLATLEKLSEAGRKGIYHLSGNADITYAELAEEFVKRNGFSRKFVRPTMSSSHSELDGHHPKFATLDNSRLTAELGLTVPVSLRTILVRS